VCGRKVKEGKRAVGVKRERERGERE
jgi:hypothetical protein